MSEPTSQKFDWSPKKISPAPEHYSSVNNLSQNYDVVEMKILNANNTKNEHNKREQPVVNDEGDFDDDEDDDKEEETNDFLSRTRRNAIALFLTIWNNPYTPIIISIVLLLLYAIYFGFAMRIKKPFNFPSNFNSSMILSNFLFSNNRGMALFVITIIVMLMLIWDLGIKRLLHGKDISIALCQNQMFVKYRSWAILIVVFIACVGYLIADLESPRNLISLAGIITFLSICILMSNNPAKINWHILLAGFEIQFVIGIFLMRTEFGFKLFSFLSDEITHFLKYTDAGTNLVFGPNVSDHRFAFKSIPVIIFFSCVINLMYYLGIIQYLILKVSWVINLLMSTSPTESMNATANIFLGLTEAPLLIKPFLNTMTKSELFSVMTGGFATVAGSVLAAYIDMGIAPNDLVVASIMAAPGALLVSKTIFPETKKTRANWDAIRNLPKGGATNVFDAVSQGASNMVGPIGGIITNVIAFMALFAFIDSTFMWFFSMLDLNNFGLSSLMQYLFWPFAFLMGVDAQDCRIISQLIGYKVFVNEFSAYQKLGDIIKFQKNLTVSEFELYRNNTIPLPVNVISLIYNPRSLRIATFAICGFANFSSVGITIGGMSILAPKRAKVFTRYAVKAMFAGNITNFLTACIAGLLYKSSV